jgi:pyruvate,water dikinase
LVENEYLKVEGSYFTVIYNNTNLTTLFKDLLNKKNKKNKIQYLKLITGLQDLSHLQPSFSLWDLSRKIRDDKEASEYFSSNDKRQISTDYIEQKVFPLRDEFEHFITEYGFHSEKEINLLVPHWHENPEQVVATLMDLISMPDTDNIRLQNKKQKEVFEEEFNKIKSKKLKKEVLKHRYFLWLREEYRDRSTQMYDIIRTVFLEAGKRLVKKGILTEIEDLFFVYPSEVVELFEKSPKSLNYLDKNKIIYKSFRNFNRPNEIWNNQISNEVLPDDNAVVLSGIACSFGLVEGTVFVAKSVKDAAEMQEGQIMITQFTDPSWTVHFSKIIGLVTETGGVLSHGAIISREYGIPAILGVDNITKTLKTGDRVRINGSNGTIELLT